MSAATQAECRWFWTAYGWRPALIVTEVVSKVGKVEKTSTVAITRGDTGVEVEPVDSRVKPMRPVDNVTPARLVAALTDWARVRGAPAEALRLLGIDRIAPDAPAKSERVTKIPPKGSEPYAEGDWLGELYARAARLLGQEESELRTKYGKLNPGLQGMNLRNRLRHAGWQV